jgi:phage/plasmid-like protein (TIGR03299 family)
MAHEVESMMYVGQAPWHGLGVPLQNPPTIEEAIRLAGLDWTVSTKPVALIDGGIPVPSHRAVVRDSDGRILGMVGKDWRPLQNRPAFEWFNPILASGAATLETAGSLRDGARVFILAKIGADPVPDDGVALDDLLSNGHDGTLAARVGFTDTRVVCANTLAAAHASSASAVVDREGIAAELFRVGAVFSTVRP